MQTNLDPIRILRHKAMDPTLDPQTAITLWTAAMYLEEQNNPSEKIALWIEGRL